MQYQVFWRNFCIIECFLFCCLTLLKLVFMDFLFRYSHHHYYHQYYRILFAQMKAELNRNSVVVFFSFESRDRSEGVEFESLDSNLGFPVPKVIHFLWMIRWFNFLVFSQNNRWKTLNHSIRWIYNVHICQWKLTDFLNIFWNVSNLSSGSRTVYMVSYSAFILHV